MNTIALPFCIIASALAGALFVYGGYDDSPGAQLLAVVIVAACIVGAIKRSRKTGM